MRLFDGFFGAPGVLFLACHCTDIALDVEFHIAKLYKIIYISKAFLLAFPALTIVKWLPKHGFRYVSILHVKQNADRLERHTVSSHTTSSFNLHNKRCISLGPSGCQNNRDCQGVLILSF